MDDFCIFTSNTRAPGVNSHDMHRDRTAFYIMLFILYMYMEWNRIPMHNTFTTFYNNSFWVCLMRDISREDFFFV